MSGNRLRSPVVLLALVACAFSATAPGIATVPAPARQPSVTTDVVYGHKDGLALTLDVHRPAHPNGAGLISIVSGGWQSSVELARIFTQAYPPLNEKGFTKEALRDGRGLAWLSGMFVARLPAIAAGVNAGLSVQDAQPLDESIRERDASVLAQAGALAGVTALVLLMSAMGIFSLMSASVSRRTREIGLRAALGANPRHLLAEILSRAFVLMGSGITAGGALLLLFVALGGGPTGRSADDVVLFAGYLAVTAAVMLTACLLACIEPARRALRINPIDALRDA